MKSKATIIPIQFINVNTNKVVVLQNTKDGVIEKQYRIKKGKMKRVK